MKMEMKDTTTLTLKYNGSVKVRAGWRHVQYTAIAKPLTEKAARVLEITHIDGEPVTIDMSRTGSRSQAYNGHYWAGREKGKVKVLANCRYVRSNAE